MLSDPEEEYAEMLLKAQPLLDAVSLSTDRWFDGEPSAPPPTVAGDANARGDHVRGG